MDSAPKDPQSSDSKRASLKPQEEPNSQPEHNEGRENTEHDNQEEDELQEKLHQIDTDPELKETFQKRSKNGLVSLEQAIDVLNDWSIGLSMDCEQAKIYYDRNTSPIPPELLVDELDFIAFSEIFKRWLQEEVYAQPKQQEKQLPDRKDRQQSTKDPNVKNKPLNDDIDKSKKSSRQQSMKEIEQPLIISQPHQDLIKLIFEEKHEETHQSFLQYAELEDGSSKIQTINKADLPLLLRNLLYNHNATLYEKDGEEDNTMRNESLKNIKNQLEYKDFRKAAINFITKNPHLVVIEQPQINKSRPEVSFIRQDSNNNFHPQKLEEDLLNQIEKYQVTFSNTNSEVEKQVVRNLITTLVKQLDVIREAGHRDESSMFNASQMSAKKKFMISFSNITRPINKIMTDEQKTDLKLDAQLKEIFLFFCKQQFVSGVHTTFDQLTREQMSLGMFMLMCQNYGMIEDKIRVPYEINNMEKKRRGIPIHRKKEVNPDIQINEPVTKDSHKTEPQQKQEEHQDEQKQQPESDPKQDLEQDQKEDQKQEQDQKQPKSHVQKQEQDEKNGNEKDQETQQKPETQDNKIHRMGRDELINVPPTKRNQYSSVGSKFKWWDDDLKFEKYYKPIQDTTLPQKPIDYKYLTREEILKLFKRSSFSKDLNFDEFKQMLGLLAQKIFFDPLQPGKRHENAYLRMMEQLNIDDPIEFRKQLNPIKIPFNCKEKEGFREPVWREGMEYKLHEFTQAEKDQLSTYKHDKSIYLKEKLQDQRSQINQSAISSISMNNSVKGLNSSKLANYQSNQSKLGQGKLDLNRQKVSWDQLEHISFNDLQGMNAQQFRPNDLIDNLDDEEDKYFLQEFNLGEDKQKQINTAVFQQKQIELYGSIKQSLRPTQKYMLNQQVAMVQPQVSVSQPSLKYPLDDSSVGGRYNNYNPYNQYNLNKMPQSQQQPITIKNQYLQRAQQIQRDQNEREQQIMQHIDQEQQRKGLYKSNKQNRAY